MRVQVYSDFLGSRTNHPSTAPRPVPKDAPKVGKEERAQQVAAARVSQKAQNVVQANALGSSTLRFANPPLLSHKAVSDMGYADVPGLNVAAVVYAEVAAAAASVAAAATSARKQTAAAATAAAKAAAQKVPGAHGRAMEADRGVKAAGAEAAKIVKGAQAKRDASAAAMTAARKLAKASGGVNDAEMHDAGLAGHQSGPSQPAHHPPPKTTAPHPPGHTSSHPAPGTSSTPPPNQHSAPSSSSGGAAGPGSSGMWIGKKAVPVGAPLRHQQSTSGTSPNLNYLAITTGEIVSRVTATVPPPRVLFAACLQPSAAPGPCDVSCTQLAALLSMFQAGVAKSLQLEACPGRRQAACLRSMGLPLTAALFQELAPQLQQSALQDTWEALHCPNALLALVNVAAKLMKDFNLAGSAKLVRELPKQHLTIPLHSTRASKSSSSSLFKTPALQISLPPSACLEWEPAQHGGLGAEAQDGVPQIDIPVLLMAECPFAVTSLDSMAGGEGAKGSKRSSGRDKTCSTGPIQFAVRAGCASATAVHVCAAHCLMLLMGAKVRSVLVLIHGVNTVDVVRVNWRQKFWDGMVEQLEQLEPFLSQLRVPPTDWAPAKILAFTRVTNEVRVGSGGGFTGTGQSVKGQDDRRFLDPV